jgi:MFS family permease
MYLTFPAFAPVYAKKKHSDMNPFLFSIIASMYNLSRLLLSTTIGATMNKVGKKNYIVIGYAILIICCGTYATLEFIPDEASDYFFFGGALAINFVQGIGGTILQIAGQAIILQKFSARKEVCLAYLSACRGLGFLGGPLLGQLFFNAAGFSGAFLIFAGILFLTVSVSFFFLPPSLNVNPAANKSPG